MIPQWRWEETRSRWVCVAEGDSCARGTFLAEEARRRTRSERRSREGKSHLPHFLWVLNAAHFCQLGWNCWPSQEEWCNRYWSDPQTSQAKRNNQVTDRNNYMLQVIQDPGRVLSSYSKFLETKTSIQRWFSHNKKLYASKEVKRSPLNCFRGQILSENKKPQEINPGMPRKHIS